MIAHLGRLAGLLLCLMLPAGSASAACQDVEFEEMRYTLCEVTAGQDLRLFLRKPDGTLLGGFGAVNTMLAARGERLVFAMNGGMYHADRRPVGLYVEDGREVRPLVEGASDGNFGMVPNGVLCIAADRFEILTTPEFARRRPRCSHATQSGPMLVVDGALHPRFIPGSESRFVRNGVGVSPDGRRLWLAISSRPVSFHAFARLFRDGLGVRDALYMDGKISRLWAPGLGRRDFGLPMGPIIGLVAPG